MRGVTRFAFLPAFVLLCAVTLCLTGPEGRLSSAGDGRNPEPNPPRGSGTSGGRAYHHEPPAKPLPKTMDPAVFLGDRSTFVAYSLASRIRSVLYQEPCFCGCDKFAGHESLLDCFVGEHGKVCNGCKSEAIFCFIEHEKGKTAAEIRKEMNAGEAWKVNIEEQTEQFFPLLQLAKH
jgi:uncharacterized protein with PCYCGC motif